MRVTCNEKSQFFSSVYHEVFSLDAVNSQLTFLHVANQTTSSQKQHVVVQWFL